VAVSSKAVSSVAACSVMEKRYKNRSIFVLRIQK
jgi:hypothetical protein